MYLGGLVAGGWRLIPVIYAVALVVMAVVLWFVAPKPDHRPGRTTPMREHLQPLKRMRVWRFSLYYVAVFGAYVALSSALPFYYEKNYDVPLWQAGLLTALFIFPASLLRPLGGWLSDKVGARRIMYWTFGLMLLSTGVLMMPSGYITVEVATSEVGGRHGGDPAVGPRHRALHVLRDPARLRHGHRQGRRLQAHPRVLPARGRGRRRRRRACSAPSVASSCCRSSATPSRSPGCPTALFGVLFLLTLACLVWMHLTVVQMLHRSSPHLNDDFEQRDHELDTASAH